MSIKVNKFTSEPEKSNIFTDFCKNILFDESQISTETIKLQAELYLHRNKVLMAKIKFYIVKFTRVSPSNPNFTTHPKKKGKTSQQDLSHHHKLGIIWKIFC